MTDFDLIAVAEWTSHDDGQSVEDVDPGCIVSVAGFGSYPWPESPRPGQRPPLSGRYGNGRLAPWA